MRALSLLAFVVAIASPVAVAAEAGDEVQILSVIQILEDDASSATWPDATLTFSELPKTDPDRTRLWRDVPGNQLNFQSRIEKSQIVVHGNRATAYVAVSGRWYLADLYTGEHALVYDYHVLQRRGETWKISATARRVVNFLDVAASRRFTKANR